MRGSDAMQESLFMVAKLEDFVPADHPLRPIRALVNQALTRLNIASPCTASTIAPESASA